MNRAATPKAMAKKKKKKTPPEIKPLLDAAVGIFLSASEDSDPLKLFMGLASGLEGFEEELIRELAKTRKTEALRFLCLMADQTPDRTLKKAAKKAIYSLEQAGLTPDPSWITQEKPMVSAPEPKTPKGWLGPYYEERQRTGLLAIPDHPTGWQLCYFSLSQDKGLEDILFAPVPAGSIKKLLKEFRENYGEPYEVPVQYVRFVILEAATNAIANGSPLGDDYPFFATAAAALPLSSKPGIYDFLSEPIEKEIFSEDNFREFFNHPAARAFLVDDMAVSFLEKLSQVESSSLTLTQAQEINRLKDRMVEISREVFTEQTISTLKRMLEETALLLYLEDREIPAKLALASAVDLERIDDPLNPSPFITALMDNWAENLLKSLSTPPRNKSDEDSPRLILPPGLGGFEEV